jgi:hypothetical protein
VHGSEFEAISGIDVEPLWLKGLLSDFWNHRGTENHRDDVDHLVRSLRRVAIAATPPRLQTINETGSGTASGPGGGVGFGGGVGSAAGVKAKNRSKSSDAENPIKGLKLDETV